MVKRMVQDLVMYDEIAEWWPLLSRPEDYEEEASVYIRTLLDSSAEPVRTVLELGSGGGNNASFMKEHFDLTLVDAAPRMLEVSKRLNPGCEHLEGDMRTLRLEREFDAVFIHDAIVYMTSTAELSAALETAFTHTRPGGVALFCPDHTSETFVPRTDHGGYDDGDRGFRYLEWSVDPDPTDSTYTVDYAFLLRESDASVRVMHDRHEEGLFSQREWTEMLAGVGFEPAIVPFPHSEVTEGSVLFLGTRPT